MGKGCMAGNLWTREQLLVAFALYYNGPNGMPYGKIDSGNPEIIHYAGLIGRTPGALAMKLANIASLDPVIIDSGRKGLQGASKADRQLWQELNQAPELFNQDCQRAIDQLPVPKLELKDSALEDFTGTSRSTMIKARVGQQVFRRRVLSAYEYKCCVTGLEEPTLLIASHISPWSEAPEHRLNPSNGLCLSSLHDRAFDQGLITFNQHLEMVLSPAIKKLESPIGEESFARYEGVQIRMPVQGQPDERLMAFHRERVFMRGEYGG